MMQTIGAQKAFLIFLLVLFCAGLYVFNNFVLVPDIAKTERTVRQQRAELNKITQNTNKLARGIELFNEQRDLFAKIDQSGFFDDQNRVEAREMLDAMQQESRLIVARYNIRPVERETSPKLQDAGYQILRSDIEFDLGAIDDSDIYRYIYMLNQGFPGMITIKDFKMTKEQKVTQPLLRNIGVRAPFTPLVDAELKVEWRTMVPDTTLSDDQGAQ